LTRTPREGHDRRQFSPSPTGFPPYAFVCRLAPSLSWHGLPPIGAAVLFRLLADSPSRSRAIKPMPFAGKKPPSLCLRLAFFLPAFLPDDLYRCILVSPLSSPGCFRPYDLGKHKPSRRPPRAVRRPVTSAPPPLFLFFHPAVFFFRRFLRERARPLAPSPDAVRPTSPSRMRRPCRMLSRPLSGRFIVLAFLSHAF